MDFFFDFQMFQPKARCAGKVQAIWSASVSHQAPGQIKKQLYSDAGSGVWFNLVGNIHMESTQFSPGVVMLPIKQQSQLVRLPPGAQLAGFRFHPGAGAGIMGLNFEESSALDVESDRSLALISLQAQLVNARGHCARIAILYRWLSSVIDSSCAIPASLTQSLNLMHHTNGVEELVNPVSVSQRQLERQFQRWVGVSPKRCQRILRVKKTLDCLKQNPNLNLAELALSSGFSDQAHMTREFKKIAKITPRQYSRKLGGGLSTN